MEPRHFWRRAAAAFIDFLLLSQLAFYMVVPFVDGYGARLSGGLVRTIACNVVPLEVDSRAHFKALGIEAENANLCVSYQNGFYAGSTLLVSSQTNAQGEIADTARTVTVPVNRRGEEITPFYPVAIVAPAVILLGFIFMTWRLRGQTIGKRLMKVQVVTRAGDILSLTQVARRETLKFAPAIVLFVIGLILPEYTLQKVVPHLQNGENITLVLGFLGASTFAYILWWVAPLIWWNGTMPYDRINKTMVERHFG